MGRSRSGSTASQADEWVFLNLFIHINNPSPYPSPNPFILFFFSVELKPFFPVLSLNGWSRSFSTTAKFKRATQKQTPEFSWGCDDLFGDVCYRPVMTCFRSWKRWGSSALTQGWCLWWRPWGWSRGRPSAPSTGSTTSSWTSTSSRSRTQFHLWLELSSPFFQGDQTEHRDHREGLQGTTCDSWIWRVHKRHHGGLWKVRPPVLIRSQTLGTDCSACHIPPAQSHWIAFQIWYLIGIEK